MDITQIRQDTPGCGDKIFLNNAGASLMPRQVIDVISWYLQKESMLGGYKVAEEQSELINGFYTEVAALLGCQPHNVAFAHDATDAYAKALSSVAFKSGDTVITSNDDYVSNQIQFLSLKQRYGIRLERINNLENGDLDLEHFYKLATRFKPRLVAITHVPTNSGKVQNVEAIGKVCKAQNIIFLVDACQSVGQLVVDVDRIGCDFLTATGRKFLRCPRGTGLLYVSDRMLHENYAPLFVDGRGAVWTEENEFRLEPTALRFQLWEQPYALIAGMAKGLAYANSLGTKNIENYNKLLMTRLRLNLTGVKGVRTYDNGSVTCNILTWRKEGKTLDQIKQVLDKNGVYYSISTLHWGLIDFRRKDIDWVVRLSPHYFNTMDEMDRVSEIIDGI